MDLRFHYVPKLITLWPWIKTNIRLRKKTTFFMYSILYQQKYRYEE